MRTFSLVTVLAATLNLAGAQVVFNTATSEFVCPLGKTAFCAGISLHTNIIIRCQNNGTVGQPGNCNDNLAGIPPVGVKFAQCYECSSTAGNAACSYNNVVYPDDGDPFTIAHGDAHCNATINTALPSSTPMNSTNISSTLSYATSASSPAVHHSSSALHVGNAIPVPDALMTTTVTSYSTSEVDYMPTSSVLIAPGSGGFNASGTGSDIAAATTEPIASSPPIQSFAGGAPKDEASYALVGAISAGLAIIVVMLV